MDELVAVVGMHRSGTSLTAHLVHELGVTALGAGKSLVRADQFNSKGYWESADLITVNTYLCNFLGCDWRHPLIPPDGWHRSAPLGPLRRRLAHLIAAQPDGRRSIKDPRMTVTLPFWEMVAPKLATVLCLRSPLGVAQSLDRREHMDPRWAVGLWAVHSALAIRNSRSTRRLFVVYEALLADPAPEAERIARFVGVGARRAGEAAASVVSPDLSHSGHALDSADAIAAVGPEGESAARLWRAALDASAGQWRPGAVSALESAADAILAEPPLPPPAPAYQRRHRARFLVKSLRLIAASATAPRQTLLLPSGRTLGPLRRINKPETF